MSEMNTQKPFPAPHGYKLVGVKRRSRLERKESGKKIYHGVSRRDTRLPKQYGGQAEF